jgi:hypothetical protein
MPRDVIPGQKIPHEVFATHKGNQHLPWPLKAKPLARKSDQHSNQRSRYLCCGNQAIDSAQEFCSPVD